MKKFLYGMQESKTIESFFSLLWTFIQNFGTFYEQHGLIKEHAIKQIHVPNIRIKLREHIKQRSMFIANGNNLDGQSGHEIIMTLSAIHQYELKSNTPKLALEQPVQSNEQTLQSNEQTPQIILQQIISGKNLEIDELSNTMNILTIQNKSLQQKVEQLQVAALNVEMEPLERKKIKAEDLAEDEKLTNKGLSDQVEENKLSHDKREKKFDDKILGLNNIIKNFKEKQATIDPSQSTRNITGLSLSAGSNTITSTRSITENFTKKLPKPPKAADTLNAAFLKKHDKDSNVTDDKHHDDVKGAIGALIFGKKT
eukprot:173185_1